MALVQTGMHEPTASRSKSEPKLFNMDDVASGGLDVPSAHYTHQFPSSAASSPAFQAGYSPPGLWSFSPVVESSTCSTETDSNEEEDDFMAGLAEQMTHLMLDKEDEEELGFPVETSSVWTSNPPSADTHAYNYCWLNGGWQASKSLLHSGGEGTFPYESMNHLSTHFYEQCNREQLVGRKVEEFLWKQALNQATQSNPHIPKLPPNVPCKSKAMPSYGYRAHRSSSKPREEDRKAYNNQGRYPRHAKQPVATFRHIRPHQQCMVPMNTHSKRASDQRCTRGLDPTTLPWKSTPNLNNSSSMRAVFLSGNGNGRESAGTGVFLPRCAGVNDAKRKPDYQSAFTSSKEPSLSMANFGSIKNMEDRSHEDYAKSYSGSHLHQPSDAVLNLPIDWTY